MRRHGIGRRGVGTDFFYVFLLVVFMIVGGIVTYGFQSEYHFAEPHEGIGFRQAAVLESYQQMDEIMLYTRSTAKFASSEALGTYFESGLQAGYSRGDCGTIGTYRAWSNASDKCFPTFSLSSPEFANHLTSAMYRRWDHPVLQRPPSYSFQIAQVTQQGLTTIYGLAQEETNLPIVGVKYGSAAMASNVLSGGSGGIVWPTDSKIVSSCFGSRLLLGTPDDHGGIDVSGDGKEGDPIYAITGGTVTEIYYEWTGNCACSWYTCPQCRSKVDYGNSVLIKHSNNLLSRYSHLKDITVNVGDEVQAGETIATLGNTGKSTGPHLDLKIYTSETAAPDNPFCFYDDGTLSQIELRRTSNCARFFDSGQQKLTHAEEPLKGECTNIKVPMISSDCGIGAVAPAAGATDAVMATQRKFEELQRTGIDVVTIANEAGRKHKVPAGMILGMITRESVGDPEARSPSGPVGIAQFRKDTWDQYKPVGAKSTNCCTGDMGNRHVCHLAQSYPNNQFWCRPDNDDRFVPEKAIDAAAKYLAAIRTKYSTYKDEPYFTFAEYNSGEGAIDGSPGLKHGIERCKAQGGTPTWACVRPYVRAEGQTYADLVVGYAKEWGGIDVGFSCEGVVGKELGSLRFKANFDAPVTDPTAEVSALIAGATRVVDEKIDNFHIERRVQSVGNWRVTTGFCQNSDPLELYFNEIMLGLQECLLNGQESCTCDPLPSPSVIAPAVLNDGTYELRIGSVVSLSKGDEMFNAPFEVVERYRTGLHEPTTITVEFQVSNNVVVNRKIWYDAQGQKTLTFKHPLVSKISTGLLGLRDLPADDWLMQPCLPTKRLHAYCAIGFGIKVLNESNVPDNPYLKFGITLNDSNPPNPTDLALNVDPPILVVDPLTQLPKWEVPPLNGFPLSFGVSETDVAGILFYCSEKDRWPAQPIPERLPPWALRSQISVQTCGGLPIDGSKDYQMVARTVDHGGNVGQCGNALWYMPSAVKGAPVQGPFPTLVRPAPKPVLCYW